MRGRTVAVLALLAALGTSGCPDDKGVPRNRCVTSGDCVSGSVCHPGGVCLPGGTKCTTCRLHAVTPPLASRDNETLTLEGHFAAETFVRFPGSAALRPAKLLGWERATVEVPADATAGTLEVLHEGGVVGSLPFRRASFRFGLPASGARLPQIGAPREPPALLDKRTGLAAFATDNALIVLDGVRADGPNLTTGERAILNADGTVSRFTSLAGPFPSRSGAAVVPYKNGVFLLGGLDGDGKLLGRAEAATVIGDGYFVAGGGLLQPRAYATATIIGNQLYVFGGDDGAGHALATVEHTEVATLAWKPFSPSDSLHEPRSRAAVLVARDRVYLLGGADASGPRKEGQSAPVDGDGVIGRFEMDPTVDLPEPRAGATPLRIGHALYLLGGDGPDAPVDTIDEVQLDPATGAPLAIVRALGRLSQTRADAVGVVANNGLYLLGGRGPVGVDNGARSSIDWISFDGPAALKRLDDSAATVQLPFRDGNAGAAVLGATFYVIGGRSSQFGARAQIMRADIHPDGTLGPFTQSACALSTARYGHVTAVIGARLYVLGGTDAEETPLASVEWIPLDSDGNLLSREPCRFTTDPAVHLLRPRQFSSAVVAGGSLYVIGGNTPSTGAFANVDRFPITGAGLAPAVAGPDLAFPRRGAALVMLHDNLWVISGIGSGDGAGVKDTHEIASLTSGIVTTFTAGGKILEVGRGVAQPAILGDTLHLLGGFNNGGYLDSLERCAVSSTDVTLCSTTPHYLREQRSAATSLLVGDHLHVIGGVSPSASLGISDTMERIDLE